MDRKITGTQNYFYAGFDKHSNKMNIQTIEGFKGTVIQLLVKEEKSLVKYKKGRENKLTKEKSSVR